MTSTNVTRLLCAISLIVGGMAAAMPCWGQQHFEALLDQTPWLSSQNAAGLCALPDSLRQNYAELFVSKDDGGWCDYNASSDSYEFGAQTSSYYRVNARLALHGLVSYSNFTGRDMTGSVWLNPADQPFDIVEIDPAHAGTKNREQYHLSGALGYDFGPGQLGLSLDFSAANQAKRRDLRSQNKYMNLSALCGVIFPLFDHHLDLGAHYQYRRSTEELLFKTYGTTGTLYGSLIDYGASFGLLEYSQSNGLTDENEERPMVTNRHTVALQLALRLSGLQWLHEVSIEQREGYYGKSSLYTPVFMEHRAHSLAYMGQFTTGGHALGYSLAWSHLQNHQNLFQLINQGGGLNEYLYYGQLLTRNQHTFDAELHYRLRTQCWYHQASAAWSERNLTASLYPDYRQQEVRYATFALSTRREWRNRLQDWSAQLGIEHRVGEGTMAQDGQYPMTADVAASAPVTTMQAALVQQYEYLTAPQSALSVICHYGHRVSPSMRLYALLSAHFGHAWKVSADVESHRESLSCTFGCTF